MSLGTKPCTCQGSNPNCYRCDGSGLIEAMRENSPNSSPASYKVLHSICKCSVCEPKKSSPPKKQPRNQSIPSDFSSKKNQAHGALLSQNTPAIPRRSYKRNIVTSNSIEKMGERAEVDWENYCSEPDDPWRDYVPEEPHPRPNFVCPHCKQRLINFARFEKHIRKAHPTQSISASETHPTFTPLNEVEASLHSAARTPALKDLVYACHLCKAVMKNAQRLAAHISKVHELRSSYKNLNNRKITTRNKSSTTGSSKSTSVLKKSKSSNQKYNSNPTGVYEHSETMDASRGWGGSFRDYGQFGSHPMYDSMDDESFS